jgi:acid phosphatase family membrane protein YuiD
LAVSAGGAALKVFPELSRDFSRQLLAQMAGPASRAAERTGDESGRRFGKRFTGGLRAGVGPVRGIFRGFGPQLAAALGGAAIAAGIRSVTAEAREAAIVGKITEARLKSTGGVANVSARQVEGLATALSNKVGADDEAIQSGLNLLLTFKGVRNEAGKGNDIFNQAGRAAVDLAAGMNNGEVSARGLKTANIQLGKALEDPIKGITALRRSGVSFTQQQRDQIKTLVESGRTLDAQKIILRAVNEQFGGTGAASADAGKRFGVFVSNIKEQIGTALLPIINRLLGFLVDKLPGALATVGRWFKVVATGVQVLGKAFSDPDVTSSGFFGMLERIGSAARAVVDWFLRMAGALGKILVPAIRSIQEALRPAIAAFVEGLLPGLKTLWHVIATGLWPILKALGIAIGVVLYAAIRYVLPLILRLAGPVLGFLIGTIAKAIGWLTTLIRWFARVGVAVFNLGRIVVKFVGDATRWIGSLPGKVWSALSGFAAKLRNRAGEGFVAFLDAAKKKWEDIKEWAKRLPAAFARAMGNLGKALIDKFSGAIKRVLEFLGLKRDTGIFAQMGRMMIDEIALGIADRMKRIPNLLGKLQSMAGAALFGGPSIPRGSYGSNRDTLRAVARSYGWADGAQWIALANLISGESGFNNLAQNPTSTAFGMFQFLDSTWSSVGAKKTADPWAQSVAGLRYIASRYGSPVAAYGAWLGRSPHWYAEGGIFRRPTIIGVGERGPEAVTPLNGAGGGIKLHEDSIRALAAELRRNPPQVSVQALGAAQARHDGILGRR